MPSNMPTVGRLLARIGDKLATFPFAATIADPEQQDCPIVWCNDKFCELTGYLPNEVIGRNCRFLQGGLSIDTQNIKHCILNGEDLDFQITNFRNDGSDFDNFVSMRFIRFGGQRLICASQGEAYRSRPPNQFNRVDVIRRDVVDNIVSSTELVEKGRVRALRSWSILLQSQLRTFLDEAL